MTEWFFLVVLVLGLPAALLLWLIVRTVQTRDRLQELTNRLSIVEHQLESLRCQSRPTPAASQPAAPAQSEAPSIAPAPEPIPSRPVALPPPLPPLTPTPRPRLSPVQESPPELEPAFSFSSTSATQPVPRAQPDSGGPGTPSEPTFLERLSSGSIDWEKFVGVNLLMWLGGLAAFLTVVFAVKYSFDRNWITPELRVAGGFLAGLGILVAGVVLHRRRQYLVGAQTFCATGIVILYATTFACRSIYHFELFGVIPTFLLMTLITATAFVLAVQLEAKVVAVLGILAGFLTPLLLSTGQDNPLGLFGYIALLDLGLLAVALRQRWHFLSPLGAIGTVLMQLGWIASFFDKERYFEGDKVLVAMAVFLGFGLLFVLAWFFALRRDQFTPLLTAPAIILPAIALAFTFYIADFQVLGQRPGLIFTYLLLADLLLLFLVWADTRLTTLQHVAGAGTFLFLGVWTLRYLSNDLLNWALAAYFGFATLHAALPFVLHRVRPGTNPLWWGHLYPPAALLLLLAPMLSRLDPSAWLLWPVILLVDLLVIVLAVLSASVLWILLALGLTLVAGACWITAGPADLVALPGELTIIGIISVFFIGAGVWAARRLGSARDDEQQESASNLGGLTENEWRTHVPALAACMPFTLLILVVLRLPLADPSPVFGLALLLVVLMLGLARMFPLGWLPPVALGCVLALEHVWHLHRFQPETATIPLLWYAGFTLLFASFPFLFWRQLSGHAIPWITAALAGPFHFYLVHRLVKAAWPNDFMGLLPLAFAVPSIASLVFLVRSLAHDAPKRNTLLALFGGATLFFVTLVFPIQFDRQWITLGWALEGVALLWLFHRIPHPGLHITGAGLLVVAFARLALNFQVFQYHARSDTPIFNWYLYTYGVAAICMFAAARLLIPPKDRILDLNARVVFLTCGTILLFLLLNIEIADYFTEPGAAVLTFQFSGNLARDMSYSIGWALFALALVVVGIARQLRPPRYAGIALLGVTVLKLFFHDLARLEALYRIGALLALAIVTIAASFLYQRFFAQAQPSNTPASPPASPPTTPA